jgi:hypothetical protein
LRLTRAEYTRSGADFCDGFGLLCGFEDEENRRLVHARLANDEDLRNAHWNPLGRNYTIWLTLMPHITPFSCGGLKVCERLLNELKNSGLV